MCVCVLVFCSVVVIVVIEIVARKTFGSLFSFIYFKEQKEEEEEKKGMKY